MTFDAWLTFGMENGWAGPGICIPHDGYPTTEAEDEDPDQCWHAVRLYPNEVTRTAVEENHSASVWRKPPVSGNYEKWEAAMRTSHQCDMEVCGHAFND